MLFYGRPVFPPASVNPISTLTTVLFTPSEAIILVVGMCVGTLSNALDRLDAGKVCSLKRSEQFSLL